MLHVHLVSSYPARSLCEGPSPWGVWSVAESWCRSHWQLKAFPRVEKVVRSGTKAGGGDLGSGDHGLVPLTAGSFNWFFSHRHQQPLISAKTMAVLQ